MNDDVPLASDSHLALWDPWLRVDRRVRLVSRQHVDHTDRFRELADVIATLKAPTLGFIRDH